MSKKLIRPTDIEDAQIAAAELSDPDNLPLTDAELSQFKRGRGGQQGSGWQTRINDALLDWVKHH